MGLTRFGIGDSPITAALVSFGVLYTPANCPCHRGQIVATNQAAHSRPIKLHHLVRDFRSPFGRRLQTSTGHFDLTQGMQILLCRLQSIWLVLMSCLHGSMAGATRLNPFFSKIGENVGHRGCERSRGRIGYASLKAARASRTCGRRCRRTKR